MSARIGTHGARWLSWTLGAAVALAPRASSACSVCMGSASDAAQKGFLIGSVFLSVLPLVLIGAIAFWVRRRARLLANDAAAGVIRLPEVRPRRAPAGGAAR